MRPAVERSSRHRGFTLIELMAVVAIIAIVTSLALPHLKDAFSAAREGKAISELTGLDRNITEYLSRTGELPASWSDLEIGEMPKDPWGNQYIYHNHDLISIALIRRDGPIIPLNSDYDFFSTGPDGEWLPNIANLLSVDDIVRAENGEYFGLARNY